MDITVLGPLEARLHGRSITPTAAKPRQVLTLLALHPRGVVSVPTIVDELWGEKPPRSSLTTLQTYILQLRRLIGAASTQGDGGAKDVLTTRFGGYLLDIGVDDTDAGRFERLAEAGRRAFELGDFPAASRLLRDALDLWSGPAMVDVGAGNQLAMEITRLEETRLATLETRIDAELRMGRHQVLVGELAVLVGRHPMHENFYAQYMIALYRSGRTAQSLDAYSTLRSTLIEELGVEPSGRLQHLQQLILSSDPSLDRHCVRELELHLA